MYGQLLILLIFVGFLVGIVVIGRRAKRSPPPPSTKQANMFSLHWKDYGWGRRIGIIAAFIVMAAGALGIVAPSLTAATHLRNEVDATVFLGCSFVIVISFGLLTRLNSRFFGIGWTAMIVGLIGMEVTQKESDSSVGTWIIVLMAYWLVRIIKYVEARVRQRKPPAPV